MEINKEYYFKTFKHLVIFCKRVNQSILEYEDDRLLHLLKNYYRFSNTNIDLESQLDMIDHSCDMFSLVELNIERKRSNKKIVRIILLMYYRTLKKYLKDTGNVLDYNNQNLVNSQIGNFITNMPDEEKQSIYERAIKDLEDEVSIVQNQGSIVTLLKRVISENHSNSNLINQLESYCLENTISSVLYPSCYRDLSDLDYFFNFGNTVFSPHHLFIHVDFWNDIDNSIQNKFGHENVYQETYVTSFSAQSKVSISKIKFKKNIYWFLFFNGTRNEQLLQKLIYDKVPVETIISKCDGITSGMGHPGFSISTPLYISFHKLLQVKRLITEYTRNFIANEDQNWKFEMISGFIDWLSNNLNQEDSQLIIEEIQDKSYDQIIIENTVEHLIDEANGLNYLSDDDFRRDFVFLFKVN